MWRCGAGEGGEQGRGRTRPSFSPCILAKGWEPPSCPVGVVCGSSVGEVRTDPQPRINEGNNGVDYVICSFVFVRVKGCARNVCTGIAPAGMRKKLGVSCLYILWHLLNFLLHAYNLLKINKITKRKKPGISSHCSGSTLLHP